MFPAPIYLCGTSGGCVETPAGQGVQEEGREIFPQPHSMSLGLIYWGDYPTQNLLVLGTQIPHGADFSRAI